MAQGLSEITARGVTYPDSVLNNKRLVQAELYAPRVPLFFAGVLVKEYVPRVAIDAGQPKNKSRRSEHYDHHVDGPPDYELPQRRCIP